MKLTDILLLSSTIGFTVIGIHQSFTVGLTESYWIFMLSVSLLLLYKLNKKNGSQKNSSGS